MKLRYCDGYFIYLDSFNSLWILRMRKLRLTNTYYLDSHIHPYIGKVEIGETTEWESQGLGN